MANIPNAKPIIRKVYDKSQSDFEIHVTLDTQQADFEWKEWETTLKDLGRITSADLDPEMGDGSGFLLVDVQFPSLREIAVFIFRKLPGNTRTVKSIGSENLVPSEFRDQITRTETRSDEERDTDPDELTGNMVLSRVEQAEGAGLATKLNVSEEIDESAEPLVRHTIEEQDYLTVRTLVPHGTQADCGEGVVESEVAPFNKVWAIKTTKYALSSYTDEETYSIGFQALIEEQKGDISAVPRKFRDLQLVRTWKYLVSATTLVEDSDYPSLGVGTGDYIGYKILQTIIQQRRKTDDYCNLWDVVVVGIKETVENIISYGLGDGKLRTTITESLVTDTGEPPENTATITYEKVPVVPNLWVQVKTEQTVFDNETRSIEKPDSRHPYIRATVGTQTLRLRVSGEVEEPTLQEGEISKTERQETEHIKYVATTTTDQTNYPVSWTNQITTAEGRLLENNTVDVPGALLVDVGPNVVNSQLENRSENEAHKVTRVVLKKSGGVYIEGHPKGYQKSKGAPILVPQKFRRQLTTTQTVEKLALVDPDNLPEPETPTGNVTENKHIKINDELYAREQTTTDIDTNVTPLQGEQIGEYGIEKTSQQLVVEGTTYPGEFGKEHRIEPTGDGTAVKTTKDLTDLILDHKIGPLVDYDTDQQTGIVTRSARSIVKAEEIENIYTNASSVYDPHSFYTPADATSPATFKTYKARNKWESIEIITTVVGDLPADEIYYDHENLSLPDELLDISCDWSEQSTVNKQQNAWAYDTGGVSLSASISGGIALKIKQGFSGKAKSKVIRSYHLINPSTVTEPINIQPVKGSALITTTSQSMALAWDGGRLEKISGGGGTNVRTYNFGPILDGNVNSISNSSSSVDESFSITAQYQDAGGASQTITVPVFSVSGLGQASLYLPSSTPSKFFSGDIAMKYQRIFKWQRAGVWIREIVEVYVP